MYANAGTWDYPPFFQYDHVLEKIYFYQSVGDPNDVFFSINLNPFIGEGFNMNWYYQKPPFTGIVDDIYSIVVERDVLLQTIVSVGGTNYIKM